ncbi:Low-density lipoprotein receptor-related protein 6 [Acipenser ruthenus]|uniref:Low-density lipoprotein receptor-related protein 6 n=1 Tax=Acipenser ruthenus TaxID=7906 RepID=A0A444UWD8_ACIRT|nr:Low-density lipoprotein receptor-related protein 6 [Acipenser ruthenus]
MNGSFSCGCHPGYLLELDGRRCKAAGQEPFLLASVQFDLLLYGLRSFKEDVLTFTGKKIIFSVDYDWKEKKVFWLSLDAESIKWITMDKKNKGTIVKETPSPFSLSVFEDVIYWSDTKMRTIQKANKDTGKNRTVLIKRLGQPFGLKVIHETLQPIAFNPCQNLGCSHLCLLGPKQSGMCRCPIGFLLANDGTTCVLPADTAFLFLVSPSVITQVYLKNIQSTIGLKTLPEHKALSVPIVNQITAMDYVLQDQSVYAADSEGGFIALFKLKEQELVFRGKVLQLEGDVVTSLAVDWITHNIYWSSRQQLIHVTLASKAYTTILFDRDLSQPNSIAVHPPSGVMCFSHMQEEGAGVIGSILLNGLNYKEYKTGPERLAAFTHIEKMLFWTTVNDTTKVWYSDGLQTKHLWFEVKKDVVDLKVYSKFSQQGTNHCVEKNGGCSHICLPYPGGRTCKCHIGYNSTNATACGKDVRCPEMTRPCKDGRKCLLRERFCDGQADCLDESDEENCADGVRSLAVDWFTGQLYWTNRKRKAIYAGAADGSGYATVLGKNIDPKELVLLPAKRVRPSPSIALVLELQASGGYDPYGQEVNRLISRGWVKIDIFDSHNRVISGRWKVPIRILPVNPRLTTGEINAVPQLENAELYLRIVNARDADVQSFAPITHNNAGLYKYPPQAPARSLFAADAPLPSYPSPYRFPNSQMMCSSYLETVDPPPPSAMLFEEFE